MQGPILGPDGVCFCLRCYPIAFEPVADQPLENVASSLKEQGARDLLRGSHGLRPVLKTVNRRVLRGRSKTI